MSKFAKGTSAGPRFLSLKKELALLFLAGFYFLIATNTQTGWLFVLSAFLLGVLAISWVLSRRSLAGLKLEQRLAEEPRRGSPARINLILSNHGSRGVQEVKVESPAPSWALEREPFEWAIPRLPGGAGARADHRATPTRRGLHKLPEVTLIHGAPFGLFAIKRSYQSEESFLVYPEIEKLPVLRSRSRIATALGELTSPKGLGDTRSLRSVRDYRPGDDLRQVHWKASAKRGPAMPLLVREHHAPGPTRLVLLLDTSGEGLASPESEHPLFERAVTLVASILWAAHREGTQAGLLLREANGEWEVLRHWPAQYESLARVQPDPELSFATWSKGAEYVLPATLCRDFADCQPSMVKAALAPLSEWAWPEWVDKIFLVDDPTSESKLASHPGLVRVDGTASGFQEVTSRV